MTRSTTKKTTTKKTAAAKDDPLAAVREDTPNPELTDLDRDTTSCFYCGRDAVATVKAASKFSTDRPVCERHKARAEVRGQDTEKF